MVRLPRRENGSRDPATAVLHTETRLLFFPTNFNGAGLMDRSTTDADVSSFGDAAQTYRDMVAFAHAVETRPLGDLLAGLPGLAHLSEAKFQLAATVLRKRFRAEPLVIRQQLKIFAHEIAVSCADQSIRSRIMSVFDSLFSVRDLPTLGRKRTG